MQHHRRSIRLKGHDYAGGGTYFVTICGHRNAGNIFSDELVKAMVGRVGAGLVPAQKEMGHPQGAPVQGAAKRGEYIVMPDHFHGIVRIRGGGCSLGDVVGAFKSLVVHHYIAGVKAGRFVPFPGKIWHRNYYERIIRDAGELENIQQYIRMNPWKLVVEGTHEGSQYRAIGNSNLLNLPKLGVLCSRNTPSRLALDPPDSDDVFLSGFHSPPEKEILTSLLQNKAKIICCPAWGIDAMKIPENWLSALEDNRMLILEMKNRNADLAASRVRNSFVMRMADTLWMPHVSPNGMLAHLVKELQVQSKMVAS